MAGSTVFLQPAFILQQKPYRETSMLLEVFTRDHGIVSLLAKGVRKQKSTLAGSLMAFNYLNVSYVGHHELKTLTHADFVQHFALRRLALYCGFYVNELLQRFMHRYDPYPELFQAYLVCLEQLAKDEAIEPLLRRFELMVLQQAGYALDLTCDALTGDAIETERRYRYQADFGLVEDTQGIVSGTTLCSLAQHAELQGRALVEAKALLRTVIDHQLQGRPLKSREVLGNILQYL